MIIDKGTHKEMQCDDCGMVEQIEAALVQRWTYSQGGHHCAECQPKEIAM
jgi:hypothetical protein